MITRRRIAGIVGGAVILALFVLTGEKAYEIACRKRLVRAGFPLSYAERLAPLAARHGNWRFVPLRIDDVPWPDVIDRECKPGVNLVVTSKWAPGDWLRYGVTNYTPYIAANAKAYDSGAWYQASREAVAYFMDPRNFLNETEIFMFETLKFNADSQTPKAIREALVGSFMDGSCYDGGKRLFADLLLDVGRDLQLSPVFLAARLKSEQGAGTVQGFGTIGDSLVELYTNGVDRIGSLTVWGKTFPKDGSRTRQVIALGASAYNGYYNLFNIGAGGNGLFEIRYNAWREATSDEVCRLYRGPWTSQEKAIRGGAAKIKERFVDGFRYTRYFQKFSVVPAAGALRWKQYMQNIAAPLREARNTFAAYQTARELRLPFRFIIPVYTAMPTDPAPDPAHGQSTYSPTR